MSRGAPVRHRSVALVGPIALLLALASCSSGGTAPTARTATVTRGDVTAGVSAIASFAAVSSENLGFATGGKLTSVKVKVGQHVTAGDTLATIDSRVAKHALEQAEANLAAQQAGLDRINTATTVSGAQNTADQAQAVLTATKGQVAATAAADQKAIERAKTQLSTDKDVRDDAEDAVSTLTSQCRAATAAASSAATSSQLLAQAQKQLAAGDTDGANATLQQLSQLSTAGATNTTACSSLVTAQSAVAGAKQ